MNEKVRKKDSDCVSDSVYRNLGEEELGMGSASSWPYVGSIKGEKVRSCALLRKARALGFPAVVLGHQFAFSDSVLWSES